MRRHKHLAQKSYQEGQGKPTEKPAAALPNGWKWVIDAYGGGKLVSPDKTIYVEYWTHQHSSTIEYFRMGDEEINGCDCSLKEFMQDAEEFVGKYFLHSASSNSGEECDTPYRRYCGAENKEVQK